MASGSDPADLFEWEDKDAHLLFAQDVSQSGRFAQQWKLRMMAQGAALKKVANNKLPRLLVCTEFFNCTNVQICDTSLSYKTANRKSAPRRRGPADIPGIDETGATARFQPPALNVACYRVRKKVDEKDVGDDELDPLHARMWERGTEYGRRDGCG